MRVVVYGSSSKDTPQAFKDASFEFGKLLAQRGHVCVNGGGNTGCMGSLSDGCLQHGGKVRGLLLEGKREGQKKRARTHALTHMPAPDALPRQVVGVIHEMFVVDGEEHTGVSEMLVYLRMSVFVRVCKCACVCCAPVHRGRTVPARLSLLRENLPRLWEREHERARAPACTCVRE